MLDKSFLDKHDTDPDEEDGDNDVSPSTSSPPLNPISHHQMVRGLQFNDPSCSSLSLPQRVSPSSPGCSQNDGYRAESRSTYHDADDENTEREEEREDDNQSNLSDHGSNYHNSQQQPSSPPLPTPPPPPTSLPPTHQRFLSNTNPQFYQHLTIHREQATLPSPHSVSGSDSSLSESHLNQRIKSMVKKNKKCSIDKKSSKCIGGIKSRPVKYLKHPLDRSVASFFVLTLFFTCLALLTGLPVTLTLTLLLLPSMLIVRCLNCTCKGYPVNMVKATPLETYWLNPKDFPTNSNSNVNNNNNNNNNNHNNNNDINNDYVNPDNLDLISDTQHLDKISDSMSTCLLFFDRDLNIDQLRDVFMTRVVQKPEMARFRSLLTFKGLIGTPVWLRLTFEEFSIEKQIINDRVLTSRTELKNHLVNLMACPLPANLPPWQIRRCCASYLNQVILILRIHQSLVDGCGLAKLLVQYLADQAPPKTTTFIRTTQGTTASTSHFKPRFGGINFTINLIRALIVGPLTFTLWTVWAFTKRKHNYLTKKKLTQNPSTSNNVSNLKTMTTGKVLSSSSSKNSCTNSKYIGEAIVPANNNNNSSADTSNILNNGRNNVPLVDSWINQHPHHNPEPMRKYHSHNSIKSIYWTTVELSKLVRAKQVTRTCLNDVILTAITGSIRQAMVNKKISNPPDIGISLPIDIRGLNDPENDVVKVKYVILTLPLPTSIEGAIPRLWEIRHNMEELKTSADPSVMFGAHFYLSSLLPGRMYRWLINLIHRNSSISLSNVQGPTLDVSICSHRLRKVLFWMSPPPAVSIGFNCFSYENRLYVTVTSSSELIPCAKALAKGFKSQVHLLNDLLSKRRVPGEGRPRKRPTYIVETPFVQGPYLTSELTAKLNAIQLERYQMSEMLESSPTNREDIEYRLEELKDEFSDLMKQLRRRKSMADYAVHNIVINVEDNVDEDDDDDMDGELRPAMRRFSFNVASRRSSVASAISMPSSRFQVSPPHLSRRYAASSPEPSSPSDSYIKEETSIGHKGHFI